MTALVLVFVGLLVLAFDAADFTITGLSALAVMLILIGLWLGDWFARETWIADADTSRRLDAVDREMGR